MTQNCLNRFRECMRKKSSKSTEGVEAKGTGTSLIPVKQTKWQRISDFFYRTSSIVITVGGLLVGILVGYLLLEEKAWSKREVSYVGYLGEVILNIYSCLVLPLVASSVITATATLDKELTQRIGLCGVLLIIGMNLISGFMAVALCLMIKPGHEYDQSTNGTMSQTTMIHSERLPQDFILDVVRNMFPSNYIQSVIEIIETELVPPPRGSVVPPEEQDFRLVYKPRTNQVGLTILCVALGIAISRAGVYGHCIIAFCHSMSKFLLSILSALQVLSPFMVVSLIAAAVVQSGLNLKSTVVNLGPLIVAISLTLACSIVFVVLLYTAVKRRLPYEFARALLPAILTSIGNSSSVVTLPVTYRCLDDLGVSPRSSRFLVPAALVWNWGSTAYMGVAIMFAAQLNKHNPPRWADIWKYSLTAVVAGTTVQPVPQGSVISLLFFLPTLGLDPSKADIVGALDCDPLTTAVNVLGGAVVAAVVDSWNHKDFHRLESFERDLHMVANLVRLNQALEETLEEEEAEEEEQQKLDDEEAQKEVSLASETEVEGRRRKRRGSKGNLRFRRKMFGTSAVGRLLDKTLSDRPAIHYWARPAPLRRGSALAQEIGRQNDGTTKLKVASNSKSFLSKTSRGAGNRVKRKSRAVKRLLPKSIHLSRKRVKSVVSARSKISKKKSKQSRKGKKTAKGKSSKAVESALREEEFEADNEAIRENVEILDL